MGADGLIEVALGRRKPVAVEQDVDLVVRGGKVDHFGERAAESTLLVEDEAVAFRCPEEFVVVETGGSCCFFNDEVEKGTASVFCVEVVFQVPEELAASLVNGSCGVFSEAVQLPAIHQVFERAVVLETAAE